LPHRIRLPQSFAVGRKAGIDHLKLPDALGDSLNAAHLVGCLKRRCNRNTPAGSHLSDIGRDHLKAMARIPEWRKHSGENVQPFRLELCVISCRFDLVQNAVGEGQPIFSAKHTSSLRPGDRQIDLQVWLA
jgi:hypothetical protein